MVDLPLARSLIEALPTAARLVLVGDVDQLPSVGPGAVLRDIIESGVVPTVRLTHVFRQVSNSRIVSNAHGILQGERPVSAPDDASDPDFFISLRKKPEEVAKVIVDLVTQRIPRRFGLHPSNDIQVLTPMHSGAVGTRALNQALQSQLNPKGDAVDLRGASLRTGDKVMQLRNDYERDVFNGDVGRVVHVNPESGQVRIRFDGRDVSYESRSLENLTLAYASTVHKSQGSEYPAVVIPLVTQHYMMLSRNLLYTAVTRARRLCILVADRKALELTLAEVRREDRRTGLAERLRNQQLS
jgi:exodeoxyribonuclease V alpha subunit